MNAISAALVKAQKKFSPALKTSTNPHFRSKYADLSAVVEAVIDALNDNGIFLSQVCHDHDGGVSVETKFVHESGEVFSAGTLSVPASKNDPQGYGSALTYARRYSLMAACGIAPEDDDGNASVQPKKAEPKKAAEPKPFHVEDAVKAIKEAANEELLTKFHKAAKAKATSEDEKNQIDDAYHERVASLLEAKLNAE